MTELLRVEGFDLSYPAWRLQVEAFTVRAGDRIVLMGPSGVGKSTFLRWLCGLPLGGISRGVLWLSGERAERLPPEKRGLGVLFQEALLLPHLSLRENVELVLEFRRMPREQRTARVQPILEALGLAARAAAMPETLSGGEKTRAALARAVVLNPRVLVLDEPFASLNEELKRDLRAWLTDWTEKSGSAILLVSHDEQDAAQLATQVYDFRLSTLQADQAHGEVRTLVARSRQE